MKYIIFMGFIILPFGGCINDSEVENNTYMFSFPLIIGKSWTYEFSTTFDDSLVDSSIFYTIIVAQKTNQTGFPVFEFRDSSDHGSGWFAYYEKRPSGLYLINSESGGISVMWRSSLFQDKQPRLLVPFSFMVGDEWIYNTLLDSSSNIKIPLKRVFQGIEKVTTKNVTYDCYKFETNGYLDEKRFHYYCSNIGLVKKEVVIDSFAITIFDPITQTIKIDRYVQKKDIILLISSN